MAQDGLAYDMNKIESLDLSKVWWSQFARENLTVHDAIFFISGDMNFMDKWTAVCMFFNKNVAAGYSITAGELYDLVDERELFILEFVLYVLLYRLGIFPKKFNVYHRGTSFLTAFLFYLRLYDARTIKSSGFL